MTNDNAPDYVCIACSSKVGFGPAYKPDGTEVRAMAESEKQAALTAMGWRVHGDSWLCAAHPVAESV
jgi:hypothetical protein